MAENKARGQQKLITTTNAAMLENGTSPRNATKFNTDHRPTHGTARKRHRQSVTRLQAVVDPDEVQWVRLNPLPVPCFKYHMKMTNLVSKLFHYHGIFKILR